MYTLSNDRIKELSTWVSDHCGEESYQVASHMHTTLYGLVSNEYPSSCVTHSQSFPTFPHAPHSLSTRPGVTIHWTGLLDRTTGLTQNGVKMPSIAFFSVGAKLIMFIQPTS